MTVASVFIPNSWQEATKNIQYIYLENALKNTCIPPYRLMRRTSRQEEYNRTDEYLSPLFLLILQPDLQLPHHHLSFPLSYGAAGFIVSGHQGVDVSEDHIDDGHLLQQLLTVELLSAFNSAQQPKCHC